jgi:hypothetical protein
MCEKISIFKIKFSELREYSYKGSDDDKSKHWVKDSLYVIANNEIEAIEMFNDFDGERVFNGIDIIASTGVCGDVGLLLIK